MSENSFDIIIVGLGIMGSQIFYQSAKANKSVLGLEQFDLNDNTKNTSHGQSRGIRPIYQKSFYRQLYEQSLPIWDEIQKISKDQFLFKSGALVLGSEESKEIQGTLNFHNQYNYQYTKLSNEEVKKRYPAFKNIPKEYIGVFEQETYILNIEKAIQSSLKAGINLSSSSKVQDRTRVLGYQQLDSQNNNIKVTTDNGIFYCKKLVLAAGMWMTQFLKEYNLPFILEKNYFQWLKPKTNNFKVDVNDLKNQPVVYMSGKVKKYIIFPDFGQGVRVNINAGVHYNQVENAEDGIDQKRIEQYIDSFKNIIPDLWESQRLNNTVCYCTVFPDGDFLLDFHPENKNVILCSTCCGHGCKLAPQIGKVVLKMIQDNEIQYNEFNFKRLQVKRNNPKL